MRFAIFILLLVSRGAYPSILDLPIDASKINEFWVNTSYSTEKFDAFNYSEKVSSTTKFDNELSVNLGFNYNTNYKLSDYTIISRGSIFYRTLSVDRTVEPKSLEVVQYGLAIKLQLMDEDNSNGFEFGFYHSKFPNKKFHKYQIGNVIFGEDIVLYDPTTLQPLPLLEIENKEIGTSFHYLTKLTPHKPLHFSIGYRLSEITPEVDSRLFHIKDENFLDMEVNGSAIRDHISTLKRKSPQNDKWYEHIFDVKLIYLLSFNEKLKGITALSGYYVTESNYEQGYKEKFNATVDARLMYSLTNNTSIFASWHAASNYTLGIYPGTYNQQTASFFGHPYSYLSAGVSVDF